MQKSKQLPVALTIAGSDSGGGAGIQADLMTFAALGVHGTCAITSITAQNPNRVRAIEVCRPDIVRSQIEAVFEQLPPAAAKTGMLSSASIVSEVARFFSQNGAPPLVVDPVIQSTSGAQLLEPSAIEPLCDELLRVAAVVTPNLNETQFLTGHNVRSEDDMRLAARELHRKFGCAVLVKGGHLRASKEAVDIFYDGRNELRLGAAFDNKTRTHGTGCTLSAAITAYLARGLALAEAVRQAKEFVTHAIARSIRAGKHAALNHFWQLDIEPPCTG